MSTEIYGNEPVGSERNYKADIVLHYNGTKGAITTGDQVAGEYSCIWGTKNMAFRLFMETANTAAFNTYVFWTKKIIFQ